MLGAVDSERIKSPHYLFVTGNADSENTEKCKTKSQVLVNAVKIHQSKGTENGMQGGRELFWSIMMFSKTSPSVCQFLLFH